MKINQKAFTFICLLSISKHLQHNNAPLRFFQRENLDTRYWMVFSVQRSAFSGQGNSRAGGALREKVEQSSSRKLKE